MDKIFRIITVIAVFGIVYIAFQTIPGVQRIINCYEVSRMGFEELEVRSRAQGWSKKRLCEIEYNSIIELNQCLVRTRDSYPLLDKYYDSFYSIMVKIRVDFKRLEDLQTEHDRDCSQFPATMFEPEY